MADKLCVLDESKKCSGCGECLLCDIDPSKKCDDCMKCLDPPESGGFRSVKLAGIRLEGDEYEKWLEESQQK